jgi:hypothetical protein
MVTDFGSPSSKACSVPSPDRQILSYPLPNFRALSSHHYIIPTALIRNVRIILGLVFAPTEERQASKLFGEVTVAKDFFDDVRELYKG